jgi:transcriptional regulator of arginine metabolism
VNLSKAQRQHLVAQLLEHTRVTSQSQLVSLLADHGVVATQATVSRDLEDLGAVKIRVTGGDTAYALPELPHQQVAPEEHLRRVLGEWAVEVGSSGPLVVVRTPPGSAHVVGSALDRSGLGGMLGTVAGDDTVLVVAEESTGGAALAEVVRALAGLEMPSEAAPAGEHGAVDQEEDGDLPADEGASAQATGHLAPGDQMPRSTVRGAAR